MNLQEAVESKAIAQQSKDIAVHTSDLAEQTKKLAEQTTRDSSSMITIAAVTMFFLPTTFVSVSSRKDCSIALLTF